MHQAAYLDAFGSADRVVLSPLGRDNIPDDEQLDLDALVAGLDERGLRAERAASIDGIVELVQQQAAAGDTVALLSNGAFGGIHEKMLAALGDHEAGA